MKDDISLWVAILIAVFLLLGSSLTLIGTIGLVRFSTFYERLHMPSLSASWGGGSIIIASLLYSIFVDHHWVFHEVLLVVFLFVTTPVTSMLLSQAAAHRDHPENWLEKPPAFLLRHREEKSSTLKEKESG
ncbi:hypothetical protein X471_00922 [Bartonella bacilliformis str. Heidi Mejia]|uniref:monovalent cation/H(+) antiporter subunit G n=1 Tax=Bartonella bacilliformis TaxID=774 RepID=UPI000446A09A|nr:monovalent cation/H(+) antiporter subunit G [Bartonella bacilliformis]EYS90789.1 hypothetical protein X471_00922 [Bartonella bacilliformis str. Heidi Mejia]EYS95530.1 hypothetical protein X470_00119 [Bartonella bacilliformis Peru-18]KEG18393.1 hypothetical protein H709_00035 [Bartonella bacilliformis CUSCO5]KEG20610.1 hypothetical protein H707_00035 [Bartonella bacilliformis Hosp800-02]KEG24715.1 hypothetical protein H703_00035 [Bartonella bacilliformis Ver075]